MKKKSKKQRKRVIRLSRMIGVFGVLICMLSLSLLGSLFFFRPSTSLLEKRDLETFPALTWDSFWNGDYFSQISLWYSDTFPNRDGFIAMNQKVQNLYGLQQDTMVISTGSADEIGAKKTESDSSEPGYTERHEAPENLVADVQDQVFQGLLVQDGAAYGGYYFVEEAYEAYLDLTERLAEELDGSTQIYSIIIPNNSGVLLDEQTVSQLGGSDQKQAIDYYYSSLDERIIPVGTIDTLREHNDEYLYFRTDHHWTPLGAYYVYRSFADAKGVDPIELEDLKKYEFEPFIGSYASELGGVELTPDEFICWVPNEWNSTRIYMDESEYGSANPTDYVDWQLVNIDEDMFDQYNHYLRLIYGDRGFEMIDNPEINDGSSALVIKESYGNAFVPWITNHYDKVYVVDFRYNEQKLLTWLKENEIDDLILINNMQLMANPNIIYAYEELFQ